MREFSGAWVVGAAFGDGPGTTYIKVFGFRRKFKEKP